MRKKLPLIFMPLFCIACQNEIEINSLTGEYVNLIGADNYISLSLFSDSTFTLVQSPNWGDVMISNYGRWRTTKRTIELEESEDLENWITYSEFKMNDKDSLFIYIEEDLSSKIGDFKAKLNIDTVIWENPTQLKLDKSEYFYKKQFAGLSGDKLSFYEYYPSELLIWNQEFFLKKWYVFSNYRIEISLDKSLPEEFNKLTSIKYQVVDNGNLIPIRENDRVVSEELSKRN